MRLHDVVESVGAPERDHGVAVGDGVEEFLQHLGGEVGRLPE